MIITAGYWPDYRGLLSHQTSIIPIRPRISIKERKEKGGNCNTSQMWWKIRWFVNILLGCFLNFPLSIYMIVNIKRNVFIAWRCSIDHNKVDTRSICWMTKKKCAYNNKLTVTGWRGNKLVSVFTCKRPRLSLPFLYKGRQD